jgi:hypothetical protein
MLAGQAEHCAAGHAGHEFTGHDHEPGWCSGSYFCETCRQWVHGEPCNVATRPVAEVRRQLVRRW